MSHSPILVTGATGKTGTAVATQLLALGRAVRAVVHRTDARSERLRSAGAQVVVADLFDPAQLREAMRGVARAYYCPPWHPFMIQSAAAFAVAAAEAKLEAIVGLTQWLASPAHPSLMTRQSWLADHLLAMVPGAAHVILNPGFFADNYLGPVMPMISQLGVMPWPFGDARNAPPANEDIARVAVAALLDPARHAGRTYRPTGPELLDRAQMAATMSRVLGRRVRVMPMPMPMFFRAMRAGGFGDWQLLDMRVYAEEARRGTFAFNAPTSDVLEVTGEPAESFEATARRYLVRPEARRTPGNMRRALGEMLRIGLTGLPDLDRVQRRHRYPVPPIPALAIDDAPWQATHAPAAARPPSSRSLSVAA